MYNSIIIIIIIYHLLSVFLFIYLLMLHNIIVELECVTALFQTRMKFSENEVNMITNKFQSGGKEMNDRGIGNLKAIPIITGL